VEAVMDLHGLDQRFPTSFIYETLAGA